MAGRNVSVAELLEIHRLVKEEALADRGSRYEDHEGRGPSDRRLIAIVSSVPPLETLERAAWLLRAILLVQPFPDGNHRTGLLAAELFLGWNGIRFRPSGHEAARFQRDVSGKRFGVLGGYDDAPLALLADWDDEVMACCVEFVKLTVEKQA